MGAWGVAAFDNDDASDWAYELENTEGEGFLADTFAAVIDAAEDAYLDLGEAAPAVAAAETVATMAGRAGASVSDAVAAWARAQGEPSSAIRALAHAAIARVRRASELKDLWEESESYDEWLASLDSLEARIG